MTVHLLPLFSFPPSLTAELLLSSLWTMHQIRPQVSLCHTSEQQPSLPLSLSRPYLSLSNSSLCSVSQNQAQLPITAQHSLAASIGVSSHPSLTCQSTLIALAKQPFYVPQTTSIDTASHAYQFCQLASGKAKQTAVTRGDLLSQTWESWSSCWQSGDSLSASDWSFGPGSYWDG
jgi:hypothetical protein